MNAPEKININDHIRVQLPLARDCACQLINDGFTVLEVKVGPRKPRITIQTTKRCSELRGIVRASFIDRFDTRKEIWCADLYGCQIEWQVRGTS